METYRVLIVEDDPTAAEFFEMLPYASTDKFDLKYTRSLKSALAVLKEEHFFDVILLDLNLKDSLGLDTLDSIHKKHSSIPIVVVTGEADKETGLKAIARGAEDYLVKAEFDLKMLARAIGYAVHRKNVEKELRDSQQRYKKIYDAMIDYAFTVHMKDSKPTTTTHHNCCEKFTGYTKAEFDANADLWLKIVHKDDKERVKKQAIDAVAGKEAAPVEYRIYCKDGQLRWIRHIVVPFHGNYLELISYDNLIVDITKLKDVET